MFPSLTEEFYQFIVDHLLTYGSPVCKVYVGKLQPYMAGIAVMLQPRREDDATGLQQHCYHKVPTYDKASCLVNRSPEGPLRGRDACGPPKDGGHPGLWKFPTAMNARCLDWNVPLDPRDYPSRLVTDSGTRMSAKDLSDLCSSRVDVREESIQTLFEEVVRGVSQQKDLNRVFTHLSGSTKDEEPVPPSRHVFPCGNNKWAKEMHDLSIVDGLLGTVPEHERETYAGLKIPAKGERGYVEQYVTQEEADKRDKLCLERYEAKTLPREWEHLLPDGCTDEPPVVPARQSLPVGLPAAPNGSRKHGRAGGQDPTVMVPNGKHARGENGHHPTSPLPGEGEFDQMDIDLQASLSAGE